MFSIIIYTNLLPKSLMGVALFPFIILHKDNTKHLFYNERMILINHEKIHISQQVELLILPFYLMYIFNYMYNLIKYNNHNSAYMNIIFEKEAYKHETNLNYLKKRKIFQCFR